MKTATYVQHPWHIAIGQNAPEEIIAVIEIPQGSRMKYELDKDTGLLHLDRILYSSVSYPANYGLLPQTYYDDGDPLDILVLSSFPISSLCTVAARVIGMMKMEDEHGLDDKIIAVASGDPEFNNVREIDDLTTSRKNEIMNFFDTYKLLEEKAVEVKGFVGRDKAVKCVQYAMDLYQKKFANPQS
ncbi:MULTISPECIES: inorganic diphosphatase [Weeksellaceae]|uniref:inorganic diphosphatase n=1 Tax=Weeksellaceae TaxID=2762318 RepID=UPI001628FB15|nr:MULTISPECIES: inorganic diphosphatase [Weeksellaceae]MDE5492750.1 inorganic diphosphatase [Elizabethkingia meningoseptica]